MKLFFNGKELEICQPEYSLSRLLEDQGFKKDLLLVRINGKLVQSEAVKSIYLRDKDVIDTEHVLLSGG